MHASLSLPQLNKPMPEVRECKFICAFVALLYGFFGVTCLIAPHFLWGPDSVLSYWEEMDESGTWFCRMMANAMLWMVLGPFFFGVDMVKACQVYLVWGALGLVLFVQAAFFLDTSGPGHNALLPLSLWIPQVAIQVGLLLWICHALFLNAEAKAQVAWFKLPAKKGKGVQDQACWATAALYTFFGVTLYAAGKLCWGPESLFAYWTEMDESGEWFGRMLGATMTCLTCSFAIAGVPYENLAKQLLMFNLVSFPLFLQAAFTLDTTGPGDDALVAVNLWYTQLPIALVLIALNIRAVVKLEPLATVDSRELF